MSGFRQLGLLVTVLLVAAPVASRAHAAPPPRDQRGSFSVLVENDVFSGTDRHYTNGIRFSWLSPNTDLPGYARWLARNVPLFAPGGRKRIGYAFGQNIYTPQDIHTSAPVLNDRPYAGWLYGEVGLTSETGNRLDSMALSLGVIGPASLAGTVQKTWHRWFGFHPPRGWGNQLHNEPAINLTVDRQWRYLRLITGNGLGMDVTPHIGAALGNVFTYAATGATFRFGEHLQDDFGGPPRIRPSLPGASYFTPHGEFGWYLFAGAEGRAVARNIFLDGNTFSNSQSVDKKTLVGDLQLGLALVFPRFRITYTQVFRTNEFYGQQQGDRFGAISLTARF